MKIIENNMNTFLTEENQVIGINYGDGDGYGYGNGYGDGNGY